MSLLHRSLSSLRTRSCEAPRCHCPPQHGTDSGDEYPDQAADRPAKAHNHITETRKKYCTSSSRTIACRDLPTCGHMIERARKFESERVRHGRRSPDQKHDIKTFHFVLFFLIRFFDLTWAAVPTAWHVQPMFQRAEASHVRLLGQSQPHSAIPTYAPLDRLSLG